MLVTHTLRGLRHPSCRAAVKRCDILSCPWPASRVLPAPSVRSRAHPSAGAGAVSPLRGASVRASYPPLGGEELSTDRPPSECSEEHVDGVASRRRAPETSVTSARLVDDLRRGARQTVDSLRSSLWIHRRTASSHYSSEELFRKPDSPPVSEETFRELELVSRPRKTFRQTPDSSRLSSEELAYEQSTIRV